jgi:outer membrane protein assembly factor BamB
VVSGVIAILLMAGGALAAVNPGWFSGGPSAQNQPAGGLQLAVHGHAPGTEGAWSSGAKVVWRTRAEHHSPTTDETRAFFNGYSTRSSSAWGLTDLVGDVTFDVWALDPSTGEIVWGHPGNLDCADDEIGGLVPCLDTVPAAGTDHYKDVLELVDWKTGKAKTTTALADLGIGVSSADPSISVVSGAIIVTLPDYENTDAGMLSGLRKVVTAKISADGATALWVATSKGCEDCDAGASLAFSPATHLQHGILTTRFGEAYNFETGKSLLPDGSYVTPVAEGVLAVAGSSAGGSTILAPDSTTVRLTTEMDGWTLVDRLPPQPLRLTFKRQGEESAIAQVSAFDAATGTVAWTSPVELTIATMPLSIGRLSYDGQRLVILAENVLTALDASTGKVLWSRAASSDWYSLQRTKDGTILVGGYLGSVAIDPETGLRLWDVNGDLATATGPDGQEQLLELGGYGENQTPYVARLSPANRLAQPATIPAEAPACPAGMTPISWTQYAGGGILLCEQGEQYRVIYSAHADWQAAELRFLDGGYEVVFANGSMVRVSLGGAVVYITEGGRVTPEAATGVWTNFGGAMSLRLPADVKTCPAGSWPISVSIFDGGWLLVCGTTRNQPTVMAYASGGAVADAGSVTYANGAYCAVIDDAKICAYRAPAVVSTQTDAGTTQVSVTSNYFDGYGQGGAGEGTGSYGVDAPDDTAKDQVRYLTQILQKSSSGRSNLDRAVAQVRRCENLNDAITTMNGVTDNRSELLTALESTPVDAVPSGSSLVDLLRRALQLSHESDLVWVQWAEAERANDCADGQDSALYHQVIQMNHDVAAAKDDFLGQWNSQIGPAYDAPAFTRSQI